MSGRHDRKARKEIRKMYEDSADFLADRDSAIFQPKPRWIPMFVWLWLMSPFIRIKKSPKKEKFVEAISDGQTDHRGKKITIWK